MATMLPLAPLMPVAPSLMDFAAAPASSAGSEFEIEHASPRKSSRSSRTLARRSPTETGVDYEQLLQTSIDRLLLAKSRPFCVSGQIPIDPSSLVLFFRSQGGVSHSLLFPINVDEDTPPALDVLISTCQHQSRAIYGNTAALDPLVYPADLPISATLDIASHPVLDAVRNTLLPALPVGHYLTVARDKLELVVAGARTAPGATSRANDGRYATLVVTLPVRFRGGGMIVRSGDGAEEAFPGNGGKSPELEWIAILGDCDYEIESVKRGCRMMMTYAIQLKSYGPAGIQPNPLITPSDALLDALSPVLQMSRGRKIAFYLTNEYNVSPAEVLADSIVPLLKGGDSLLYHAIKIYNLIPELRWTAGGYIWPVDRTVEVSTGNSSPLTEQMAALKLNELLNRRSSAPAIPAVRGPFSAYAGSTAASVASQQDDTVADLRSRAEGGGAVTLADANIAIMASGPPGQVGKVRVPFVGSNGELEKLVVNVLLVMYVP